MKLSELASEHKLDVDLLREVVEVDLSIALPKGMDTVLKEAEVKRILACDGLETADGKPFTPIIAKEFEEKHRKKVATKKGLATKKRKLEDQAEVKRREDEAKVDVERKRHSEELTRRENERQIREQNEAEQARLRTEAEELVQVESQRIFAEEEMKRRESEAKRIAVELAAMRDAEVQHQASEAKAKEAEKAKELARRNEQEAKAKPGEGNQAGESPALQAVALAGGHPATPAADRAAPAAPPASTTTAPPTAPLPSDIKTATSDLTLKAAKGLGSKLASLAKATHEKADHSIKALPRAVASAGTGLPAAADETLSSDDRRRLIQDNIRKNLAMAQKVKDAKIAARKKPGFATIDRSKTPAPPGRGGPGGNRGPAKPGVPGRGPKRDPREHRADAAAAAEEERLKPGSRRRPLSTEEVDLSGRTEFEIVLPATVREFSEASGIKSSTVIAKLFMAGVIVNINSVLEKDAVELLAMEFKKTVTIKHAEDVSEQVEAEAQAAVEEDKPEDLVPRPPVVTIMGHVDHGKTSLLDAIRKTQVAAGEAGGITQHIGAYTVSTPGGLDVTFIDTPGHEAFTEMRVRGSQVTDVVVVVVAADDGVMPQTREAINHAKAANVAIVVALNKIDKPEAKAAGQREKIVRELAEAGLQAEEWGGDIAVIGTSATTGEGITELLERLTLETEILELKANHFAAASGTVIEAHRNEGQGVTATFLVQRGSLAVGDVVLAGVGYGRVRSMTDWKNDKVPLAGPSYAVEIIGLNEMPRAGDRFQVLDDLKQAAEVADSRLQKLRERELAAKQKITTTASLFGDLAHAKKKEIRVVVKADAAGSMEVLNKTISALATDEVRVSIIHSGVGGITSSDVTLAEASKAMILGFNVIADPKARALADSYSLQLTSFTIIYEMLDHLRAVMGGMLDPETVEKVIGHADVRQTFTITKVGVVAGLFVTDGVTRRDAFMRITRENTILHTGKVGSLRRFKEDVKEVREKFECGLTVEKFEDIKVGDIMEFYTKEKVARTL